MNKTPKPPAIPGHRKRQQSLRSRLILWNVLISVVAVLSMGVYVYYRAQQANDYLSDQLSESVDQQARDFLVSESTKQTIHLNNFFIGIRKDITNLGASLENVLSSNNQNLQGYWDAVEALSRLPNGSWDNSNNDIASVFIPSGIEITPSLLSGLSKARYVDFIATPILEANQDAVAIYYGGKTGETIYYPNIDLANIVPPDFDVTKRPWYIIASPQENPDRKSKWSAPYLDAALNGLVITCSTPVYTDNENFSGVTAIDIQLNRITDIVTNIHIGETGYAFLIDGDQRVIAMPDSGYEDLGISPEILPLGGGISQDTLDASILNEFMVLIYEMTAGNSNLSTMVIGETERFIIYQPITEVGYSLAIVVPTQELLSESISANEQLTAVTRETLIVGLILVLIVLSFAMLATLGISNRLTKPLVSLTSVAEEISGGNFNTQAVTETEDEIGTLANAFNSMTTRLRDMIENLEKRVSERTLALERRTSQIQAAAEVGNAVASIHNLDDLLSRVTRLISQRFGFYHVGIFLLDDRDEYAVLVASNSSGGQKMLENKHKLSVGQVGIVGYVTGTGNSRIAFDVGEDAKYFNNPYLPETRSEMALPLTVGNRIIGALDIQSTQENAFSDEDIQTLRLVADQLAIAINNARLISTSQKAIETTKRAYSDIVRDQWQNLFMEKQKLAGMRILPKGQIVPLSGEISPDYEKALASSSYVLSEDGLTLFAPVVVMGNVIGALRLMRKNKSIWVNEDINTIISITTQLGTTLETARLYEQITDRARREALIANVTSRIGSSIDLETIMQNTVEEIGKLFKGSEVVLQLKKESGK